MVMHDANSTKEKHVTKNLVLKEEILIEIPMVIMKIVQTQEKRDM